MTLPATTLATNEVEVSGTMVTVRALSRTAALRLGRFEPSQADEGEAFILAEGTGVSLDEARQWLASADVESAGKLVDAIIELSNLPKATPAA